MATALGYFRILVKSESERLSPNPSIIMPSAIGSNVVVSDELCIAKFLLKIRKATEVAFQNNLIFFLLA